MTYQLGQLAAALEYLGVADSRVVEQGSQRPESLVTALQQAQSRSFDRTVALIAPIMGQLPSDTFEQSRTESPGSYWLGYHHWKAAMQPTRSDEEPDLDSRLEIRLEQALKDWTHLNGGAALVRRLLREARRAQQER